MDPTLTNYISLILCRVNTLVRVLSDIEIVQEFSKSKYYKWLKHAYRTCSQEDEFWIFKIKLTFTLGPTEESELKKTYTSRLIDEKQLIPDGGLFNFYTLPLVVAWQLASACLRRRPQIFSSSSSQTHNALLLLPIFIY